MLIQKPGYCAAGNMRRLLIRLTRVFQLASDDLYLFWSVYAYLDLILAYLQHGYLDIVGDYQALIKLSCNYEHGQTSS